MSEGPLGPLGPYLLVTLGETMLDWSQCPEVESSPERFNGAWVFRGTYVPLRALFEKLALGTSVERFLEWYPSVDRDQVETVIDYARQNLLGFSEPNPCAPPEGAAM